MPLKNLFLVVFITMLITSVFYASFGSFVSFFQKTTGYTSIVIYGTVEAPPNAPETQVITGTVEPSEETAEQSAQSTQPIISTVVTDKKDYVNSTILSQIINQTESSIAELNKLRTSSLEILNYYSSINDVKNSEKWINVVTHFNQALDDLEDIRLYSKTVKNSATKEDVDAIKDMISDAKETLEKIITLIKA